jgi:RES domain-containing protein
MIHRLELLSALEAAPTGRLQLKAWRHMFGSGPPDKENNRGARWNPAGVPAIYFSTERDGAIAEGDHAMAIQPFRPSARRTLYLVELTLGHVVDLSAPSTLSTVDLTPEDIADDDLTACQEVGAAVEWLGNDGLLVPSARSVATNLVVYPNKRAPDAISEYSDGETLS